ncbi:hypothetical protein D9M72_575230 [compost metagenome]
MYAKDLADHQHHRQVLLAFRLGPVGGHAEAAGRNRDLAGGQAGEIGLDGLLRHHRQGSRGKGGTERGLDEAAAVEGLAGDEAFHFRFEHACLLEHGWLARQKSPATDSKQT